MSCKSVQRSLSSMLDGRLADAEHARVEAHLAGCRECAGYANDTRVLRSELRNLPPVGVPASVTMQLRVIASREIARATRFGWFDRVRLAMTNVLRPLAMPAAGGLFASVLMFALLVDALTFHINGRTDVSLGLYTQVSVLDM